MHPLANHRFLKMNGLGNRIVVLDLRDQDYIVSSDAALAAAGFPGSDFDQLMVIHDPKMDGTDAFIRIYNTDGSEAGACGNGTRCVAWAMLSDEQMGRHAGEALTLHTKGGILPVWRRGERDFTVDMGMPKLKWSDIPLAEEFRDTRAIELQIGPIDDPILHSPAVVNMGNPHAIFFVDDIEAYALDKIGPLLEHHPLFPDRANISLAHVVDDSHINLKVWERGVGLTLACGSAACAATVSAVRKKMTGRTVTVTLPGGDLIIEWRETNERVYMTGPVTFEHEGHWPASLFHEAA